MFDFDTTLNPILVRLCLPMKEDSPLPALSFLLHTRRKALHFTTLMILPFILQRKLRVHSGNTMIFIPATLYSRSHAGHCLQGIYNNRKSPDIVRAVFGNGAMIEGWAVYTESMMLENGWANFAPEMELVHDKLKMREIGM